MKILHICSAPLNSGAGRGAMNLHEGLLELGVDSKIMTTRPIKDSMPKNIEVMGNNQLKLRSLQLLGKIDSCLSWDHYFRKIPLFSAGLVGSWVTKTKLFREADIIHIQWMLGGMLSIGALSRIKKPVVWTFRDMWPFTGGCHYSLGCERFTEGCGRCPMLRSSRLYDASRFIAFVKQNKFSRMKNLHPVGISPWLAKTASESTIFGSKDVISIWNGVNLGRFKLIDKKTARVNLELDPNVRYIAFGSVNLKSLYKGGSLLHEALKEFKKLWQGEEIRLLSFGKGGDSYFADFPNSVDFGQIDDDKKLNLIYAAANVFAFPSVQEAFGKTIVEALSSGTPVVAFNASGPSAMINHRRDGYKAKAFVAHDFALGAKWALENGSTKAKEENLSKACASHAKKFSHTRIASEYLNFYQKLIACG